jgi:hypothetical protein
MREALKLKPLWTSYLFSTALVGAVLALIALLPDVANTQEGPPERYTVCHRPGTPEEKEMNVTIAALERHMGHGDMEGPCYGEGAICPCVSPSFPFDFRTSATVLNRIFQRQEFLGEPTTIICSDDGVDLDVLRVDSAYPWYESIVYIRVEVWETEYDPEQPTQKRCAYQWGYSNGDWSYRDDNQMSPGQAEACREDIRKLIAKLGDDCPTP